MKLASLTDDLRDKVLGLGSIKKKIVENLGIMFCVCMRNIYFFTILSLSLAEVLGIRNILIFLSSITFWCEFHD